MNKNLNKILEYTTTIAVIGLSPKPERASNIVSEYMQEQGYKIIPVYPREKKILGEHVYRKVTDIKEHVDMVVIFRRSEEVLQVVEEAIKIKPKVIWMQEGVINEEAADIARKNEIDVVMDKCIMKEYIQSKKGQQT